MSNWIQKIASRSKWMEFFPYWLHFLVMDPEMFGMGG